MARTQNPPITQTMSAELKQRPRWEVDLTLDALLGTDIRVATKAFSPTHWIGRDRPQLIPVRDLILPDNSQPAGLPVFFEGRQRHFERQIGVVVVDLEPTASPDRASEGSVCFRETTAVILRGPAVVELAFPFQVERLPADADNYARDLRTPRVQFEFPFAGDMKDARRTRLPGLPGRAPMLHPRLPLQR
jgi:hypothetical protein